VKITPFRVVLAAALAAAVTFAWSKHEGRRHDEARYAAVAAAVVGHPVGVSCPDTFERLTSVSSEAGYVRFGANGVPEPHTYLAPATCDGLREFTKSHRLTFQTAWAVQTLAHEAFHLRGVIDEAETECDGLRWTPFVAEQLGATPAQARGVLHIALSAVDDLPAEYQSPGCFASIRG